MLTSQGYSRSTYGDGYKALSKLQLLRPSWLCSSCQTPGPETCVRLGLSVLVPPCPQMDARTVLSPQWGRGMRAQEWRQPYEGPKTEAAVMGEPI